MSSTTKVCPECGSAEHSTVWHRHNFQIPALGPMEPPGNLRLRYPVAKCSVCQTEYRNAETFEYVSKAISEYVERKLHEHLTETEALKEVSRKKWIMTGLVLGTLVAHGLNLLMDRRWVTGGVIAGSAIICILLVFNASSAFNWIARRKDAKKGKNVAVATVTDDLMDKLINSGTEEDEDDE